MRRALLVALLLTACVSPSGTAVEECGADWRGVESLIVQRGDGAEREVAIDCIRQVDDRRVRIGFTMPAGPSCYLLGAVHVVEAADAVSFSLSLTPVDDPAAGACPEEPMRRTTEVDLAAPVDGRSLLAGEQRRG